MKRILVVVLISRLLFFAPLTANASPTVLHQWGENDRHGTIGELFAYNNSYNGRLNYLRLKHLGSDRRYWYLLSDESNNDYIRLLS